MILDSRIRLAAASPAVLWLAVAACEAAAPEETTGMGESAYVNVVSALADLQRFPPPGADSTARRVRADSVRQSILDRYGVTADELIAFAERVGLRPNRMEAISERIVARTDSLARARAITADSTTAAAAAADSAAADSARAIAADSALQDEDARPRGKVAPREVPIPIDGDDSEPINPRRLPNLDDTPRG